MVSLRELLAAALLLIAGRTEASVVVEFARPHHAADRAGLSAGDELVSWSREGAPGRGAGGAFDCPFEVRRVELVEAPRGSVRIRVRRAGAAPVFEMPAGEWELEARPLLTPAELERLRRRGERNLDVATGLRSLARVRLRQRDWQGAETLLRETLSIEEKLVPHSPAIADTLLLAARLARARGDTAAAETLLARALAIQEEAAPGTLAEARTRRALGALYRDLGRLDDARELLGRAAAIFDDQARSVGGDYETAAELRARNHELYFDYLRVLVESGELAEAFHVLERSRARAFLDVLAMRDLSFATDLPPELDRERRRTNAVYDQALGALMTAGEDRERTEVLRAQLAEAREAREEIRARVRQIAPRLAEPGLVDGMGEQLHAVGPMRTPAVRAGTRPLRANADSRLTSSLAGAAVQETQKAPASHDAGAQTFEGTGPGHEPRPGLAQGATRATQSCMALMLQPNFT